MQTRKITSPLSLIFLLSTLAAAYAETGDFESAKKWSQKAVEIAQKELESAESGDNRTQMQRAEAV